MVESALRPPIGRDVSSLADWVEATMLIERRSILAKAVIRKHLASAGLEDESLLALLLPEVRRRRALAPAVYPFAVISAGIELRPDASGLYEFLLASSLEDAPFRHQRHWDNATRLFEHLTVLALSALFGANTRALRFGHPPDGGRPEAFGSALAWLCEHLSLPQRTGRVSGNEQDGGVDAVAWRPFKDGSPAFPVVLAQCSLMQAFQLKGTDIIKERWRAWVGFERDPLVALAVPYALPAGSPLWHELHFTADVVLDRFRLCELLQDADTESWSEQTLLTGWLESQFEGMRLAG